MNVKAFGYVMLLGLMFGSVTVVSRMMVNQIEPMAYISSRFILAGLAFFIINTLRIGGRRWPKDRTLWFRSICYGAFGDVVQITLFISSLQYLSAGLASILNTFFPVMTVILAHFLLSNERLNWKTSAGVTLAVTGAVLILGLGETGLVVSHGNKLTGYMMLLGSGVLFSFGAIIVRKYMVAYDFFDTISIRVVSAGVVSGLLTFLLAPKGYAGLTTTGSALIFYAGIIYFFGFLLNFLVIQRYNVMIYSLSFYIIPVVATVLGMVFLSEQVTPGMIFGMLLIMSGVSIINFSKESMPDEKNHAQTISR